MLSIPGPWLQAACFWFDVLRGECYRVDDASGYLSHADLRDNEVVVRAADEKEVAAFVLILTN